MCLSMHIYTLLGSAQEKHAFGKYTPTKTKQQHAHQQPAKRPKTSPPTLFIDVTKSIMKNTRNRPDAPRPGKEGDFSFLVHKKVGTF